MITNLPALNFLLDASIRTVRAESALQPVEQVFVLWNNEIYDGSTIVGVYRTREAAEAAQNNLTCSGLYDIDVFPLL